MQPVFEGRFTGRLLLKYIQEHDQASLLTGLATNPDVNLLPREL